MQKEGAFFMPNLSRRVGLFTDSVIRRMTRICDETPGAINLSQGFPDFDPPAPLLQALVKAAQEGPHQYSITFGAEDFRRLLAQKLRRTTGLPYDPETQLVVTCGGTEAMMCAMMTVCDPGDKVVVFSPFYENYGADAILSGAEPIYVPLVPPDFHFDSTALAAAFAQRPKAIIVCNPSNPTGKVFTREELLEIGALAQRYDAYIITDEVYEHLVYEPCVHVAAAALPGLFDRVITCSSLSKTYSITGWRLGYLAGPAAVIENAKKVHDFLTVGAASPLQAAACAGLALEEDYYAGLKALYAAKRDRFCAGLDAAGLPHNLPQGAYFVLLDISRFLAMPCFAGWTDLQFCEWMIRAVGVAAVPGSSFFREPVNHLIRLHFARSDASLDEALRRLAKLNELPEGFERMIFHEDRAL